MPRLRIQRRETGTEEPDASIGRFYREPQGLRQRQRWIAMLELAHVHAITTINQYLDLLAEAGHEVGRTQFLRDLDNLRIVKHDGVYMQVSPDGDVELMAALRQRLMAVCERITAAPPNLVTFKTNKGAAPWLAQVMNEIVEEVPTSVLAADDTVWLAVPPGQSEAMRDVYLRRWRGVDVKQPA